MHDRAFAPVAAIALILLLLPLPFHVRAGNAGVLLLFFWLALGTFIYIVNAIVWWDNVEIRSPIWCDITSKVLTAVVMGGPCASICVLRRLEAIASTRSAHTTDSDKRRKLIFELSIGLGVPVLYSALSIVNQGHRFDIIESVGCVPTFYYTPVELVLVALPPLLVGITSAIYSCLTLRWFVLRRRQFNAILQSSCSGLDKNRYLRLLLLASSEVLWSLPINITSFIINLKVQGLRPYGNWENVHAGFGYIGQVPSEVFDTTPTTVLGWHILELGRWTAPVSCFIVFLFFGTSKEVRLGYLSWIQSSLRLVGIKTKKRATNFGVSASNTQSLSYVNRNWDKDDEEKSIALTPRTPSSPYDSKSEMFSDQQVSPSARFDERNVSIIVDSMEGK